MSDRLTGDYSTTELICKPTEMCVASCFLGFCPKKYNTPRIFPYPVLD